MSARKPIVIYTPAVTNRLKFTCNFIFKRQLHVEYDFCTELPSRDEDAFVIGYGIESEVADICLPAASLLFESGINSDFNPELMGKDAAAVLFPIDDDQFHLNFDVFSAIFYCLSMYESYSHKFLDEHQRIDYRQCFLRKSGLDQFPMVEIWLDKFIECLNAQGYEISHSRQYKSHITMDIDHVFAFSERPFLSQFRGFLGDVLKGRWNMLKSRLKVLSKNEADPYAGFLNVLEQYPDAGVLCFFLMREGGRDSLNFNGREKAALIRAVGKLADIGLHPSYHADLGMLKSEKADLESMSGNPVWKSRQHFLRRVLPDTYLNLLHCGIKEDYSVGYYDQPGLMACTTLSFCFYDLKSEKETDLELFPFFWMDSMNRYYREISSENEVQEIEVWKAKIAMFKGVSRFVFHNDSLTLKRYERLMCSLLEC